MLWLQIERGGRNLIHFKLEDALSCRTFLTVIPNGWISRVKAAPGTAGWSPFKGQISAASQAQVMTIVGAWFDWRANAEYLCGKPCRLVEKAGQGRAEDTRALDTKANTDRAIREIKALIERQEASAVRSRAGSFCPFYRASDCAKPSCSPPRLPLIDERILAVKCPIDAMDPVQLSAEDSSRSGKDSAVHGDSREKGHEKRGVSP